MKAAVLSALGTAPVYQDFPEPLPQNDEQVLINVKAASIHNLDKSRASGKHFYSYTNLPVVIGYDGAGILENGTKVYAQGITGMLAQQAVIAKNRYTVLPDNIDFSLAAALPVSVFGSALPLLIRAKLQKGETVLINGATGVTGHMAVQLAKHYGASKIIVTGRNKDLLEKLKDVGASETINLDQEEAAIIEQIRNSNKLSPIDVVIDYLWGKPFEIIVKAMQGGGGNNFYHKVRLVNAGEMAGSTINLPAGMLRSSAMEITGSGFGSFSQQEIANYGKEILPNIYQLASEGKIVMHIQHQKLADITSAWHLQAEPGKKIVVGGFE